MMRATHRLLLVPIVLVGCVEQLYNDSIGQFPPNADTSSSTTDSPAPTTTDGPSSGPGVQTVTGDEDSTGASSASSSTDPGSSSGEQPVNVPPTIELFTVSPEHLSEAGAAELQLVASDDVVKVRLSLDGVELAELKPTDFPRVWDALSAKDNGAARMFDVVVEDAEGLTAKATAMLDVLLPPSGAEKCLFVDQGANLSVISALKYTRDAVIAVGSRDTGAGLRLTLWKLDPDHCEVVLPGWPKTIGNWTAKPALSAMTSRGAAVDVDEAGNIIVAGNFIIGGNPQSYVALLNPAGSRLWETEGHVGDEVASVAAATAPFKNRVFVVGTQRTSDVPVRTDGAIWVYITDGESVFIQPPKTLKAPFTADEVEADENNVLSEWVRAVVINPHTGNALAVGEREFSPEGGNNYHRAFTIVVHPFGDFVGTPWTSWGPALRHDAIRAIGVCGDGFLAGGWTRDHVDLNAKPQPMMFWFQTDGTFMQHRHLPQLSASELHGVACDRESKVVSAGTRLAGSFDAQVLTVLSQSDMPVWYENGVAGDDGAGAAACDSRGFCGWAGYRTANGKPYAVVRVHHP
jgi:hypothetical protein